MIADTERKACWKVIRRDLTELFLRHQHHCQRCSPDHVCGFAIGVERAYREVEKRFETKPRDFPEKTKNTGATPEIGALAAEAGDR